MTTILFCGGRHVLTRQITLTSATIAVDTVAIATGASKKSRGSCLLLLI